MSACAVVCAAIFACLVGASASSGADAAGSGKPAAPKVRELGEVASMRTAHSMTYRRSDGTFRTRIMARAVNRRVGGRWERLDASLHRTADGDLAPAASATPVVLPSSLADPVVVGADGAAVRLTLRGARGAAVAKGAVATYAGAFPHTDVRYEALTDGVKETLTLRSPEAPDTYVYDADLPRGQHLVTDGAGLAIVDRRGRTRYVLPAPFMHDSADGALTSHDVRYELSPGGTRVTLRISRAWLDDPARRYPVIVDPTLWPPATTACTIQSGSGANTNDCSSELRVGRDASTGRKYRAVFNWDASWSSGVPADANILKANLALYFNGQSRTAGDTRVELYALGQDFDSSVTWNRRATVSGTARNWTTAGGTLSSEIAGRVASTHLQPAFADGWTGYGMAPVVERWLRQPSTTHGVMVRAADESEDRIERFDHASPGIDIAWLPHTGRGAGTTMEDVAVAANTQASVNVANGNLVVTDHDLPAVTSPGNPTPLAVDRTYNSWLAGGQPIADNWTVGYAGATLHYYFYDDSYLWESPDGGYWRFDVDPEDPDPSSPTMYLSPEGLDATLTLDPDNGRPTLTFNATGEVWHFGDRGGGDIHWPERVELGDGSVFDLQYDGWLTGVVDDLDAQLITFGYADDGGDTRIHTIADNAGHQWTYSVTDNRLDTATAPDGTQTTYHYFTDVGGNRRLDRISVGGSTTSFAYDDGGRVKTVTHDGQATTIKYATTGTPCRWTGGDVGKRVITRPGGSTTTYCVNSHDQITYDNDRPTATPSGDWRDKADGYVNGVDAHEIVLAGTDAGVGIVHMGLEEVGEDELAAWDASCEPRDLAAPVACPRSASETGTVDPSSLSEGRHAFRQVTEDYSGNAGVSDPWNVSVDRTPPPRPTSFAVDSFDATTGVAEIVWDPGQDPDLADGTRGSGLARAERRYQVAGGAWTGWEAADSTSEFDLPGVTQGQVVAVEVRTYDGVDNVSETGFATLVVDDGVPPTPSAEGELIDQSDDYVAGTGQSTLTLEAEDLGSGVASISLLVDGITRATVAPVCDEGTTGTDCPRSYEEDVSVPRSVMAEGAHELVIDAVDASGNHGTTTWTVFSDHSAPSPVTTLHAIYSSGDEETLLSWDGDADPDLSDGSPGSGMDGWRFRYKRNDGDWSTTRTLDTPETTLPGGDVGDDLEVEITAIDRVGNEATEADLTTTVAEPEGSEAARGGVSTQQIVPPIDDTIGCTPVDPQFTTSKEARYAGERDISIKARAQVTCGALDEHGPGPAIYARTRVVMYVCPAAIINGSAEKRDCFNKTNRVIGNPGQHTITGTGRGLCRAGRQSYRVYVYLPQFDHGHGKEDVRGTATTWPCNESGAWRRLATRGGNAGTKLGDNMMVGYNSEADQSNSADIQALPPHGTSDPRHGWEAHHMVPANSKNGYAQLVEAYAYACDIPPNGAVNGVWMRGRDLKYSDDHDAPYWNLTPSEREIGYHATTFKGAYYRYLVPLLRPAVNSDGTCHDRGRIVDELRQEVRPNLKDGGF